MENSFFDVTNRLFTIGKIHLPNLIKKKILEFEIFSGLANSVNWNDLQELFNPFGQGMKPDVKMHYSTSGTFMGSAEGLTHQIVSRIL